MAYTHFQENIMAFIAHEYAHFVQHNIYEDTKPHGKEFQEIYKILRVYTNRFLNWYTVIGYPYIYVTPRHTVPDKIKSNHTHYINILRNKEILL